MDLVVPAEGMPARDAPSAATLGTLAPHERRLLDTGTGVLLRVWVRRVWTLEVSLVRRGAYQI